MPNEKILLMAEANKLKVDGYRRMSVDELKDAIKRAKGTKPAKGAPAKGVAAKANGTKGKAKAKAAVKGSAVKGTAKGASAPAKSAKSPTKGAVKGTAKRQTIKKGKASVAKGSTPAKAQPTAKPGKCKNHPGRKALQNRGRYANLCSECIENAKGVKGKAKPAPVKRGIAKGKVVKTGVKRGRGKANVGRVLIDRTKVDWSLETIVGVRGGKRGEVMAALKRFKGDYDKVFNHLKDRARSYYKGKTKADAEHTLRWLVNRVAFDYVMDTSQHKPGQRDSYGESDNPINVKRRAERRAAAKAEGRKLNRGRPHNATTPWPDRAPSKGTGAPKKAAKGKAAAKPTRKPAKAQKGSQGRRAAAVKGGRGRAAQTSRARASSSKKKATGRKK